MTDRDAPAVYRPSQVDAIFTVALNYRLLPPEIAGAFTLCAGRAGYGLRLVIVCLGARPRAYDLREDLDIAAASAFNGVNCFGINHRLIRVWSKPEIHLSRSRCCNHFAIRVHGQEVADFALNEFATTAPRAAAIANLTSYYLIHAVIIPKAIESSVVVAGLFVAMLESGHERRARH